MDDLTSKVQEILGSEEGMKQIQDMAKALGQALALRLGTNAAILCIDRIRVRAGDYLDVGEQRGPAFPVVVKTLVLQKSET